MLLETSETPDLTSTSSGIITFTVIGGHGPYTYTINSSNGYSNSGTVNSDPLNIDNSLPVILSTLAAGSYVITVIDDSGNPVTQTVVVAGPTPFYCSANVTQNCTTLGTNDGQISINAGGGGPTARTQPS